MFGNNEQHTQTMQAINKLKQYIDASIDVVKFSGSGTTKEAYDEAYAWKEELGQELDEITNG